MCTSNHLDNCPPSLDFSPNLCHTNSMNNPPTDAMIHWIEERQWEEYEEMMNEEPDYEPDNELSTTSWLPLLHLLSLIHANTSNWLFTPTACRCITSWVHPTHAWCWAYWRWLHIRWASWLSKCYDSFWAYCWDWYRRWESFVWVYVRLLLIFTLRLIASQ